MSQPDAHQPVMAPEAIAQLQVKANEWYLDATFGRGGHTAAILEQQGKVIALDYDERAITAGQIRFAAAIAAGKLVLIRENFAGFAQIWPKLPPAAKQLSGALFDFGTSIEQLKYDERGLSFHDPSLPLDMRLDTRLGVTAADLLAVLSVKQLSELFLNFGGETKAKAIAKVIVANRKFGKSPKTTGDLLKIIQKVIPHQTSHLHPATKVFQALRIAVNDELTNIADGVPLIFELLPPKSRLVTIAFHEGEDRIVKQLIKHWEATGEAIAITKKPLTPSQTEIASNSRSRSAKLRVIEKQHAT